jgi:hypothetical protein
VQQDPDRYDTQGGICPDLLLGAVVLIVRFIGKQHTGFIWPVLRLYEKHRASESNLQFKNYGAERLRYAHGFSSYWQDFFDSQWFIN